MYRRRPASNRRRPAYGRRRTTYPRSKRAFGRFARKVVRRAQEKKYHVDKSDWNSVAGTAEIVEIAHTAPAVWNLTSIPQGDSVNTRDGDQIALRSLDIQLRVAVNEGYTATSTYSPWNNYLTVHQPDMIRVIVWQWFPTVAPTTPGSAMALSNILMYTSATDNVTMSPYAHPTRRDFRILYDRSHKMWYQPFTPSGSIGNFRIRIRRFAKRGLMFAASASTSAQTNGIYLAVITDWSSNPTQAPYVVHRCIKVNFSDS